MSLRPQIIQKNILFIVLTNILWVESSKLQIRILIFRNLDSEFGSAYEREDLNARFRIQNLSIFVFDIVDNIYEQLLSILSLNVEKEKDMSDPDTVNLKWDPQRCL